MKLRFTGARVDTINLGSYNYLGFANNSGPIAENVIKSIKTNGLAASSPTQEFGRLNSSIIDLNIVFS